MNQDDKSNKDLSVSEILKSIRGIIEKQKANALPVTDSDVLELTDIANDSVTTQTILQSEAVSINTECDTNQEHLISEKCAQETIDTIKNFSKQATYAIKESKKNKLTVEGLVIDLLKPQLKIWLDNNLPILVKNIVEQEIKKLIPDGE